MASRDPREVARLRGRPPAASNLTSSTKKASGQNTSDSQGTTKPKIFQYRYPLKRIEEGSDYLAISVLDYEAVGLEIKSAIKQEAIEDNNGKDTGKVKYTAIEGATANLNISPPSARDRFQPNKKANGYIYLPIPQNIQDTTSVTWGEDSLDPLSAFGLSFGADALKDPGAAVREYLSLSGAALGQLSKDGPTANALVAAIAGQAYGALGGNVSTSGLIARATGQVFNPNMELLFQGVNIRSFSFSFNFVARSMREGEEIKKIIRTFKKSMTPSNSANNGVKGVFIKSPKIFQLEYRKGAGKHPFLNSFLPMALTNVSVNYTGSNTYSTYYDGTPVHIAMQLDFQELNPLYTEDYDSGDGLIGVGY
jgi:hypothetical protein